MIPAQPQNQVELDCRTQQCPVPVLRLAKAAGELRDGGTVLIRADDPAFPKDLEAWARSAGSRILRLDKRGDYYEAAIQIGDGPPNPNPNPAPASPGPGATLAEPPDERPRRTAMYGGKYSAQAPGPLPARAPASQTFDLRGHQRQAPLLVLAKACARAQPGAVIAALVDQPEFAEELQRWVLTTNASLLEIRRDGTTIEAKIRVERPLPPAQPPRPAATPASSSRPHAAVAEPADGPERCTLLVLHNDHEALLAALLIANGAAAQGMDTSVFFTFWGLNLLRGPHPNLTEPEPEISFMQRMMKWMMPKGPKRQPLGKMHFGGLGKGMLSSIMRKQHIMSLPELMDSAQQLGVRFTACTMSMSVMGIARRDLYPYPHLEFGGVASFVDEARHSAISMVF